MIDPKILKDNPNLLKDMLRNRKVDFPFSELLDLDRKRRELNIQTQNFRHQKNTLSQSIANKKKNQESVDRELDEMKKVSELMASLENKRDAVEKRYSDLIYSIPNYYRGPGPIGVGGTDKTVS